MIFTVNVLPKSEFSGNEVAQRKRALSGEHNGMFVKICFNYDVEAPLLET